MVVGQIFGLLTLMSVAPCCCWWWQHFAFGAVAALYWWSQSPFGLHCYLSAWTSVY